MKRIIFLTLIVHVFSVLSLAQTDNEFWFAVPFASPDHDPPVKACLRMSNATKYIDTIFVEQPFPPAAFPPFEIHLAPGASYTLSLDSFTFNTNPPSTVNHTVNIIDGYPSGAVNATSWNGNKPRGNYALHIYSLREHMLFTCYYENHPTSSTGGGANNPDIWSLKGRNALGNEFYVPFQTTWTNRNFKYWPAYSSFDIVATLPNTDLTITLPPGKNDAANHGAGATFQVLGLSPGQTYTVAPVLKHENNGDGVPWDVPSRDPADRLAGAHIISNQPVAVTVKDDSNVKTFGASTAYDMIGDQLVPLVNVEGQKIIGLKYIVMRGKITNIPQGGEAIYITATDNGTSVYISDISGNDSLLTPTPLIAGQQVSYTIPESKNAIYVRGTKPIYVFHVSGFVHELGGALIPSIDGCTGSLSVSFVRSIGAKDATCGMDNRNNIFLNLMTKANALDSFYIDTGTGATHLGNASWFTPVGNSGWYVLKNTYKCFSNEISPGVTVRIWNTEDVFHLGMINGISVGGGCRYGYFSNYNELIPKVITVQSGTNLYTNCELDTVQLQAYGGFMDRYEWFPTDYLIDPPNIADPRAVVPRGWTTFHCKIKQPCSGYKVKDITVFSPLNPFAFFTVDKTQTCYPDTVITIHNKSENATKYRWLFGDGTPISFTKDTLIHYAYSNRSDTARTFQIYLETENADGCLSSFTVSVTVYPFLKADFTTAPDTVGCHPLRINFTNTSFGNVTDTSYIWEFDDGNSTDDKNPTHTFKNFSSSDTIYTVQMVATSPFYCRDTARQEIKVHPYIKAIFTADTVAGCSPLTVKIRNDSEGAIDSYKWEFGDGIVRTDDKDTLIHRYPVNTGVKPVIDTLRLIVKNASPTGCPDTFLRIVTVNPQTSVTFLPKNVSICHLDSIQFSSNPSPAVTAYLWDFGDGSTSSQQNPKHIFKNLTNSDNVYHVHLTVFSDAFCNGYDSTTVTVHPYLDPQFTLGPSIGCAPLIANITNTSKGGISVYSWNYGDGTSDNHSVQDTIHTFLNNTNDTLSRLITLQIQNTGGCKATLSRRVIIYPKDSAMFSPSLLKGCNPLIVDFINMSTGPNIESLWDFGDGTSSDLTSPSHLFNNITDSVKFFPVTLTVISEYSCRSSMTVPIAVYGLLEPGFTIDKSIGCAPLNVNIVNTSRGGITTGAWNYKCDYGVETFQKGISPGLKTFNNNNPASPTVKDCGITLEIGNEYGCKASHYEPITVYPQVIADFSTNVSEGCNPLDVRFTYGSYTLPNRYQWEFGDGSSSVVNNNSRIPFTKRFTNTPGTNLDTFTVTMYAYSQHSCWDTIKRNILVYPTVDADFTFPYAEGCSPHTINITNGSKPISSSMRNNYWTWGDGSGTNVLNNSALLQHQYSGKSNDADTSTYKCRLIAAYIRNGVDKCQDTMTRTVIVYPEVRASFWPSPAEICYGTGLISFPNSSTIGGVRSTGNQLTYMWSFGDNGSSFDQSPSHRYNNFTYDDVAYTVSLKATSSLYPCSNTTMGTVVIHPKPVASITAPGYISCPPFNLTVNNISKVDSSTYYWNFGDGSTTSLATTTTLDPVTHVYDHWSDIIQNYTLRMRTVTEHGCVDSTSQNVTVYPRVIADFLPHDTAGCSKPFIVPFTNISTRASSYIWNFGDNTDIRVKNPIHQFFNNTVNIITDTVTLIGISDYKCTDTIKWPVTIYPQPVAKFTALPTHQTFPERTVRVFNETNDGYWHYTWNFGDGRIVSTDSKTDTFNMYRTWGSYNIQLTAESNYCEDSVSQRIRIFPPMVIADFTMDTTSGCVPLRVTFTDISTYGSSRIWDFDNTATSTDSVATMIYDQPGKYQVKLQETGPGGVAYTYKTVEAYTLPVVAFQYAPEVAMLGDVVKFNNTTKYGNKYLWDFGDSTYSTMLEPTHTYKAVGVYTVKLTSWTDHGCSDSVVREHAIEVIGAGLLWFPSAFTPNISGENDGKYALPPDVDLLNEVFHPYWDGVVEYHLEIYDRWGEKLWETDDITIGWNGYYKSKLCKTDVYVWKAKGKFENGKTFDKAGNVTLLR